MSNLEYNGSYGNKEAMMPKKLERKYCPDCDHEYFDMTVSMSCDNKEWIEDRAEEFGIEPVVFMNDVLELVRKSEAESVTVQ